MSTTLITFVALRESTTLLGLPYRSCLANFLVVPSPEEETGFDRNFLRDLRPTPSEHTSTPELLLLHAEPTPEFNSFLIQSCHHVFAIECSMFPPSDALRQPLLDFLTTALHGSTTLGFDLPYRPYT